MSAPALRSALSRQVALSVPATGEEEWLAVRETLESGWLTQGPKVGAFERAFAERHAVPYARAVSSATTGLHLALLALGCGPGDEVVVPAFTWVATANAVLYCGATPVFVDVDPATFNLDPEKLAACLSPRTKAVVAVHLFGLCADVDAIRARLPAHVALVEDAACAAGADYAGRPAGSLGEFAVFSFHPRKSITTGEGGMVTTADAELAARVVALRNHGATGPRAAGPLGPRPSQMADFDMLGFNYRMTDIQAAIGLVQLAKLDRLIGERDAGAATYREALGDLRWLRLPEPHVGSRHAWQAYVVTVDPESAPASRDDIMDALLAAGIATRPGTHAVHMLGLYRERLGLRPEDFPAARDAEKRSIAIPLHNRMTAEDYGHVIGAIRGL
jgi:perosamine synthetase